MKQPRIIFILTASICLGAVFFFFCRYSFKFKNLFTYKDFCNQEIITKLKPIKIYYPTNDTVTNEFSNLLWTCDLTKNIDSVINKWLELIYSERVIDQKIAINFLGVDSNEDTIYLSLDKNLLLNDWSIYKKLLLIESLCKTLRDSFQGLQKVQLLVNHEILTDEHLDLSEPWSILGFLNL